MKLVKLGVTVDLYEEDLFKVNPANAQVLERNGSESEDRVRLFQVKVCFPFFHTILSFKIIASILKNRCKLHEETFNTHAMDTRVRTHIRCSSRNHIEEANNIVVSRGFNRSFLPYFESTRHLHS